MRANSGDEPGDPSYAHAPADRPPSSRPGRARRACSSIAIVVTPSNRANGCKQVEEAVDLDVPVLVRAARRSPRCRTPPRAAAPARTRTPRTRSPRAPASRTLALAPELDRDGPQDQEEQHQHQRPVEAGEQRRIHDRERREQHAHHRRPATPRYRPRSGRCCSARCAARVVLRDERIEHPDARGRTRPGSRSPR